MKSLTRLLMSIVILAMAQLLQAQPSVPIYNLSKPDAQVADPFGLIFNARALSNGKVLVNDGTKLQVLLYDEQLANPSVVIGNATPVYGQFGAPIITYRGDSTLFVDRVSRTLLLVDPNGRVVRAIAPVRASTVRRWTLNQKHTASPARQT